MKFLMIFLLMMTAAFAQDESVVRQISKTKHQLFLTIAEDSFEPNILGYACPWPGLRAPFLFDNWTKLHHGRTFAKDVLPIKKSELEHQFCNWPSAMDVFGPEFVIGKELEILVTVELLMTQKGSQKFLKEIITARLFGRNLESIAVVFFDNQGEK